MASTHDQARARAGETDAEAPHVAVHTVVRHPARRCMLLSAVGAGPRLSTGGAQKKTHHRGVEVECLQVRWNAGRADFHRNDLPTFIHDEVQR